jgi:hypothetical protein
VFRAPSASRLAVLLFVAMAARTARADEEQDKRVCLSSYVQAQTARQDGKLRASRQALVLCGAAACPGAIRADCVRWLGEVDDAMPTIVLSCTGPDGRDRTDARVSIDGQPLAERLDGRALAVDPGAHVLRFELPDGSSIEQRVLAREGEHDRPVVGAFPVVRHESSPQQQQPEHSRPVPLASWILGGVGVGALGVSATFAGIGWFGNPGWSSLQSCKGNCPPDEVSTTRAHFAVADVSAVVGLVALAVAAYVYWERP